jgi:hypothetical protein
MCNPIFWQMSTLRETILTALHAPLGAARETAFDALHINSRMAIAADRALCGLSDLLEAKAPNRSIGGLNAPARGFD